MQQFQSVKQTTYLPFTSPLLQQKQNLALSGQQLNKDSSTALSKSSILLEPQQRVSNDQQRQCTRELKMLGMTYIFESLFQNQINPMNQSSSGTEQNGVAGAELSNISSPGTIKMMDTILFEEDFKPKKWIFTDLLGRVQYKDIQSITINDVIRAFLVNLNDNKKTDFNNEDFMEFLSKNNNRSKICFAIVGNQRHFLHIEALCDIRNKYPKGITALQLFKIPTRDFLPYFYYHTLSFKGDKVLQSHQMSRVSHYVKDLDSVNQRRMSSVYEEEIPEEEINLFGSQMFEVSAQIVHRIQTKEQGCQIKKIKVAYLIETNNHEPWFIGTESCLALVTTTINNGNDKYDNKNAPLMRVSTAQFQQRSISTLLQNRTPLIQQSRQQVYQLATEPSLSEVRQPQRKINKRKQKQQIHDAAGQMNDKSSVDTINATTNNNINNSESVYELTTNQKITQSELISCLMKIGEKYGKDQQRYPATAAALANQSHRSQSMKGVNRLKQSQLQLFKENNQQDERDKLKERGRRIVELFPKYLEKSGSKKHAKFLFGNQSSEKVFKEYQRFRFQKDMNSSMSGAQPTILQEGSRSFYDVPSTHTNKSIFDIPMSEINNTSMVTHNPYIDNNYYHQQQYQQYQQIDDETLLNSNISIFQQQDQKDEAAAAAINSGNGNGGAAAAGRDSTSSCRINMYQSFNSFNQNASAIAIPVANTAAYDTSSFLGRSGLAEGGNITNLGGEQQIDFLSQSVIESKLLENQKNGGGICGSAAGGADRIGFTRLEKQVISLMNMGKELEGVVIADRSDTISQHNLKQQANLIQLNNSSSVNNQIFTKRRRRLEDEEAQTYYHWKKTQLSNILGNNNNSMSNYDNSENSNRLNTQSSAMVYSNEMNTQTDVPKKRSHTSVGIRKGLKVGSKSKMPTLSLLQIIGNDPKMKVGSGSNQSTSIKYSKNLQQFKNANQAQKRHSSSRDGGATSQNKWCQIQLYCKEATISAKSSRQSGIAGSKGDPYCYIGNASAMKALSIIEDIGRDAALNQYRQQYHHKMTAYSAIHPKNIEIDSSTMLTPWYHHTQQKNMKDTATSNQMTLTQPPIGGGSKKDRSIEVQQSFRLTTATAAAAAEAVGAAGVDAAATSNIYFVNVPEFGKPNVHIKTISAGGGGAPLSGINITAGGKVVEQAIQLINDKVQCCPRCFQVISILII